MTQSEIIEKTVIFNEIRDKYQPLRKHLDYFLMRKWIEQKTIKELINDKNVKPKKIIEMLKRKNVDETNFAYKIIKSWDVFSTISKNYLNSQYKTDFFMTKYVQKFISDIKIINLIESNLKIEYDNEARDLIHQIIKNSPTALYFGLFANHTLSQQLYKENLELNEESERELTENFAFNLLNDLKDQDYFLNPKVKELIITIHLQWKIKGKKTIDKEIELPYS